MSSSINLSTLNKARGREGKAYPRKYSRTLGYLFLVSFFALGYGEKPLH